LVTEKLYLPFFAINTLIIRFNVSSYNLVWVMAITHQKRSQKQKLQLSLTLVFEFCYFVGTVFSGFFQ